MKMESYTFFPLEEWYQWDVNIETLQNLMINENLNSVSKLQAALIVAEVFVSSFSKDTPYKNFEHK